MKFEEWLLHEDKGEGHPRQKKQDVQIPRGQRECGGFAWILVWAWKQGSWEAEEGEEGLGHFMKGPESCGKQSKAWDGFKERSNPVRFMC